MAASSAIKRHGGKGYLAQRIRALFPPHTRYCETHFGSGAVLLAGDGEGVSEFANDKDYELTNFWSIMRNETLFKRFKFHVDSTPLSEVEFDRARKNGIRLADHGEDVHSAVRFFVINRQSRQALGKDFATPTSRLRRGMNEQVSAWLSAVDGLPEIHARLRRVEIRCMDAVDFIRELDSPDTLFYCDPPYMQETRHNGGGEYGRYEMGWQDHNALCSTLASIKGQFLLSGYPNDLYAEWQERFGWHHVDFQIDNKASSAKSKEKKTERLWANYPLNP